MKPLKIGVIMDPIQNIHPKSTVAHERGEQSAPLRWLDRGQIRAERLINLLPATGVDE